MNTDWQPETTGWYALAMPLLVAFVLAEVWWTHRRGRRYPFAESISNLSAGLGTLLVGIFVGPLVVRGWDLVFEHADHPLARVLSTSPPLLRLLFALLLADLCYYLYHRAGHRFALLWAIHGVHHQHERLTSTVGLRLEFLADPYAALFFVLMPLSGVDANAGFLAIALLSLYTLTAHTPLLARPSWGVLVTPATHGAHHSRDARFLDANYGAMLLVWDRLFGTWREPPPHERLEDVLRVDVPSACRMHDGVTTQTVLLGELLSSLRAAGTLREAARTLVAAPRMIDPPRVVVDDTELTASRVRVGAVFATSALLGVAALANRAAPAWIELVLVGNALWGLRCCGAFLDVRPKREREDRARAATSLVCGLLLATTSPALAALLAVASLSTFVPAGRPRCYSASSTGW